MEWIGLDIGGANIKLSQLDGQFSCPFELWKHPERLAEFLRRTVPGHENVRAAVTMTGELADGYPTRQAGVVEIVDSVESVFASASYYQTSGQFVGAEVAKSRWLQTAAANWHATASWFAQNLSSDSGFIIDIGSTTTDVIPIQGGKPVGAASTDLERLTAGELVYTGIRRSPVCGIVREVELELQKVPLANEFFATIEDVYVVLGELAERECKDTADGREQNKSNAAQRIARMVCTDVAEVGFDAVLEIARQVRDAQRSVITKAIQQVVSKYQQLDREFLVCGEGEFLALDLLSKLGMTRVLRLSEMSNELTTDCAAAVAVRSLAERTVDCASSC